MSHCGCSVGVLGNRSHMKAFQDTLIKNEVVIILKILKFFEISTPAEGSLNIVFVINAKRFSNLWEMTVMSRWSRLTAGVLCIS